MPTQHDNDVYFSISNIKSMRFEVTDKCVSNGQPSDIGNIINCQLGEDGISWKLTIKAGRHNSSDVAKAFINFITDEKKTSGASIGCRTSETHPSNLNFAVLGNLYITEYSSDGSDSGSVCIGKDIVIAQGHNSKDENNWWIGGRNMQNVYDAKILKGISQWFGNVPSNENSTKNDDTSLLGSMLLFSPDLSDPNRFSVSKITI